MLNTQVIGSEMNKNSKLQNPNTQNPNTQNLNTQNPNIINNFNIIGGDINKNQTIIVEHDKINNGFTFKSIDNNIFGSFNVLQLFKLLNNEYDLYLVDINIGTSDVIIKKYIYNPDNDKEGLCELISHLESPFTGNIDLLVKLYADIIKIEDKINEEIITKPHNIAQKIKEKNNKFIYNILIRILKLSNTLIEQYKNDKIKRETLMRYSIGAAYKLSIMTQDDIHIKKLQYETIQSDIEKLKKIQDIINSKLDTLKQNIDEENTNINQLIKQLSIQQSTKQLMKGGNNTSSNSNISNNNTSNNSNTSNNNTSSNSDTLTNSNSESNSESNSIAKSNSGTPTENTRSFMKSINLNSSYNTTSADTFTIT